MYLGSVGGIWEEQGEIGDCKSLDVACRVVGLGLV